MKPLNLKETALKEEMKERCLTKGQYIDENAKAKFEMLCHLEDFEVQYWELQQENKQLKMVNKEYERLNKVNNRGFKITNIKEYDIYDLLRYKENWNKLKEYIRKNIIYDDVGMKILDPSPLEDYIQELEQGSDSNV